MNLLLLEENELASPLKRGDDRFEHITKILKPSPGDNLEAGVLGRGKGTIHLDSLDKQEIRFTYLPGKTTEPPLLSLTMIIGCPRPPTARRMVKDLVSMGAGRLIFCDTDLNEKSYLRARFWRDGLDAKAAREGAMQGKSTRLPPIERFYSLKKALETLDPGGLRLVPDLTDGANLLEKLGAPIPVDTGIVLAIGPERGWTDREREMLDEADFETVTLGSRVMRTENAACFAAGAALLALEGMDRKAISSDKA